MASFNSLPVEVQQMIFFQLPISEVIKCRLVCRSWNLIINWMRYHSLSIVKKYPYSHRCMSANYWKYPGHEAFDSSSLGAIQYELVETKFLVNLKSADGLSQLHQEAIFKNVKRMTTSFANLPDFKILINFYNHFQQLEELTFDCKPLLDEGPGYWKFRSRTRIVLELKSLKKVTVHSEQFEFSFKTPNLTSFKTVCYDFQHSYFQFPQNLEFLEADECHEGARFPTLFTNLKTLVVQKKLLIKPDYKFLHRVPSLKELFFGYDYPGWNQLTAGLNRKQRPDIFVRGIHRDHLIFGPPALIDKASTFKMKTLCLFANLSLINERNYRAFEIDYNELERLSSEEIDELHYRVRKVSTVSLDDRVINRDALAEFLRSKPPFRLEINVFNFDSLFFEKISESCQTLREIRLHLNESVTESAKWSCLEFVFKLNNLARIDILNSFSIEFIVKLLETKKSLEFIHFFHNSYKVSIARNFTINELHLTTPSYLTRIINFGAEFGAVKGAADLLDFLKMLLPNFVGQFDNRIENFYQLVNSIQYDYGPVAHSQFGILCER